MTIEQKVNQMTIEELRKELLKVSQKGKYTPKVPRQLPKSAAKRARLLKGSVDIDQWGQLPHPDIKKLDPVMAASMPLCQHVWTRDKKRQPAIDGQMIMIPTKCKVCEAVGSKWVEARPRR